MLDSKALEEVSKMAQEHGDMGLASVVKILAVARAMDKAVGLPVVEGLLADDLTTFINKLEATVDYSEWLNNAGK